ncbi:DUF3618 domain-containing protein [Nocardia donostiensis]|uniref:DUF3618 domain-containing protein n=1 Tax=Nocardia donostiensis TaxID=1538463 RepID=A0A1V2TER9_9NOCA|nr:DUF3618 domain-containing protein [Nocardia donostiensis]ONM47948.1 hypothetical protein B0T46_15030 [Nocardia donostiensis]OQS21491.1 hypothetical protein B0T44_07635 [Nocardia donostiensis]
MNDNRKPDLPNEPELLRVDRDLARQELGETVAELTSKFDVKARAGDKAHEAADAAKHRVGEARHRVADTAGHAKVHARELVDRAEAAAPSPVVDRGREAMGMARSRPVPIVAAVLAGGLVFWLIRRRRRSC